MYASEVVEYCYEISNEKEKREMIFSFYGNYFYLLQEVEASEKKAISMKYFIEKKPQIKESILNKIDKVAHKLVEKGLTRHTMV